MAVVAFVAPYLLETTRRFVEAAARLPGVQLALVTCEPLEQVPAPLRNQLIGHWRIDDGLDAGQIVDAVRGLSGQLGPVRRVIGVLEQLQVQLAQVREHLGIDGMDVGTAHNFRDKAQMKSVWRAAGVPCARHRLADSAEAAYGFASEVGFPIVVKPPAGAGAKSTFRLDDADELRVWLSTAPPAPDRVAMMEEFLTGDEGSFDSVLVEANSSGTRSPTTFRRHLKSCATRGSSGWCSFPGTSTARSTTAYGPSFRRRCAPWGCGPGSRTWSGSAARTGRSRSPRWPSALPAPRSRRC